MTVKLTLYYCALVAAALFLLIPAIYNHYPLVNPDTATYLASGFKPETPMDRPITYGLFVRLVSLNGLSLWLLVFGQSYLVSWLVFRVVKNISGAESYLFKAGLATSFLSVGTSLSWLTSQVLPEMFTPVALLCIVLLLMGKEEKRTNILLFVIYFIAIAMHMSHPLLFLLVLASLFVVKRLYNSWGPAKNTNRKFGLLVILSIAPVLIMGPALSKSKHIFMVGSLLEKGVLKKYLDDNCASKNYRICAYKDALPTKSDDFIWNDNSPLYKIGSWKGTKDEFNDIIHHTLTTPAYVLPFIRTSAQMAAEQMVTFHIGDGNFSFPTGSNVNGRIAMYFPGEIASFNASRQNNSVIEKAFVLPNIIFTIVVCMSLLVLTVMMVKWKQLTGEMRLLFLACMAGVIINCIDCATFSEVVGRYGAKTIWLIPFCAIVYLTAEAQRRKV